MRATGTVTAATYGAMLELAQGRAASFFGDHACRITVTLGDVVDESTQAPVYAGGPSVLTSLAFTADYDARGYPHAQAYPGARECKNCRKIIP